MAPPDESTLPKPPEKPHDEECCRRGCDPCIFDYYWAALDRWEAKVLALGEDPAAVMARSRTENHSP